MWPFTRQNRPVDLSSPFVKVDAGIPSVEMLVDVRFGWFHASLRDNGPLFQIHTCWPLPDCVDVVLGQPLREALRVVRNPKAAEVDDFSIMLRAFETKVVASIWYGEAMVYCVTEWPPATMEARSTALPLYVLRDAIRRAG